MEACKAAARSSVVLAGGPPPPPPPPPGAAPGAPAAPVAPAASGAAAPSPAPGGPAPLVRERTVPDETKASGFEFSTCRARALPDRTLLYLSPFSYLAAQPDNFVQFLAIRPPPPPPHVDADADGGGGSGSGGETRSYRKCGPPGMLCSTFSGLTHSPPPPPYSLPFLAVAPPPTRAHIQSSSLGCGRAWGPCTPPCRRSKCRCSSAVPRPAGKAEKAEKAQAQANAQAQAREEKRARSSCSTSTSSTRTRSCSSIGRGTNKVRCPPFNPPHPSPSRHPSRPRAGPGARLHARWPAGSGWLAGWWW